MKLRVSFYYVGSIEKATRLYSKFLDLSPAYADRGWVLFHLEGGDLALHLNEDLAETVTQDAVKYGAVVSLTVDDLPSALQLAKDSGFRPVGEPQDLAYGAQAHIRDPWGNRLSLVEPKSE